MTGEDKNKQIHPRLDEMNNLRNYGAAKFGTNNESFSSVRNIFYLIFCAVYENRRLEELENVWWEANQRKLWMLWMRMGHLILSCSYK